MPGTKVCLYCGREFLNYTKKEVKCNGRKNIGRNACR